MRAQADRRNRRGRGADRAWLRAGLIGAILAAVPVPQAWALADDRNQRIEIEADWAELDERAGRATYGGAVRIRQGSIIVTAERVVVQTENKEITSITAEGGGGLASYEQVPNPDQAPLLAGARTIVYHTRDQRVELKGTAELKQGDDRFTGALIEYDIERQRVTASSVPTADGKTDGERVTFSFDPASAKP